MAGLPDWGLDQRSVLVEDHAVGVLDSHMALPQDHQALMAGHRLVHSVVGMEGLRMLGQLLVLVEVVVAAVGEEHGDPRMNSWTASNP